jgi:hypothetical protein
MIQIQIYAFRAIRIRFGDERSFPLILDSSSFLVTDLSITLPRPTATTPSLSVTSIRRKRKSRRLLQKRM